MKIIGSLYDRGYRIGEDWNLSNGFDHRYSTKSSQLIIRNCNNRGFDCSLSDRGNEKLFTSLSLSLSHVEATYTQFTRIVL